MTARSLFILLAIFSSPAWSAAPVNDAAPPKNWEARRNGVTLELAQISPDQARAFFLGRGFSRVDAERYAAACIFTAILRNETAPAALSYRLADWRAVLPDGQRRKLKLKEEWMSDWHKRGLKEPLKIAFEWSQLPSEQTFEPGDWNQGMLTLMLPRGAGFDLEYAWAIQGKTEKSTLKGVHCAKED